LGRSVAHPEMHVVTSDQAANTILAYNRIRAKGYERIGFAGRSVQYWMFTAGFMQAQLSHPKSLRVPLLPLVPGASKNQQDLEEWIKRYKPQVIITEEGNMPDMLASAGYKVPEDLALAGLSLMDGNISAGIDQHSFEVGRVAMLMVLSLINDFAQGIPAIFRQILVEGSWIDGPSCPDFTNLKMSAPR
jgi:LacI family transcriptional regulator